MKFISCLILVLTSTMLFSMNPGPKGILKFKSSTLNNVHKQVVEIFDDFELGYEEKAYKWQLSTTDEIAPYEEQIENNLLSFHIDGSIVEPFKENSLDNLVGSLIYDDSLLGNQKQRVIEKLNKLKNNLELKVYGSDQIKIYQLHRYQGNFGTFSGFALVDSFNHQVSVFASGFSE